MLKILAMVNSVREPKRPMDWIAFLLSPVPAGLIGILMQEYCFPFIRAVTGNGFSARFLTVLIFMPLGIYAWAITNVLLFQLIDRIYGNSR
jgi:hypothetical protein